MVTPTRHPDICDRCNYDAHLCPGCGTDLSHGVNVCDDCRAALSDPTDS